MKTVIITGFTSGVGLGIAESFALGGHNVVVNGLGKDKEIEATRLASLGAGEVIFHSADMLDPGEIVQVGQTAALAMYLASGQTAQITGAASAMDGGWTSQ